MDTRPMNQRGMLVLGGLLFLLGVLALVGQALDVDAFELGWPLFVIVPGLLLFAFAVGVGGPVGTALAVPAGIVTMVGLVLAAQNATGLWATCRGRPRAKRVGDRRGRDASRRRHRGPRRRPARGRIPGPARGRLTASALVQRTSTTR